MRYELLPGFFTTDMVDRNARQVLCDGRIADEQDGDGVPGAAHARKGVEQRVTDGTGDEHDRRSGGQARALRADEVFHRAAEVGLNARQCLQDATPLIVVAGWRQVNAAQL